MSPIKHSMWRMRLWPSSCCLLLVFPTTADRPIALNSAYFRSAFFIRCALGIERSEPTGLVQRFSLRLSAQTPSTQGLARPPTAAFVATPRFGRADKWLPASKNVSTTLWGDLPPLALRPRRGKTKADLMPGTFCFELHLVQKLV